MRRVAEKGTRLGYAVIGRPVPRELAVSHSGAPVARRKRSQTERKSVFSSNIFINILHIDGEIKKCQKLAGGSEIQSAVRNKFPSFPLLRSFLRLRGWREGTTEERNSLSMFMNKAHLVQQKNNVAREPIAVSPLQSERSEDKE